MFKLLLVLSIIATIGRSTAKPQYPAPPNDPRESRLEYPGMCFLREWNMYVPHNYVMQHPHQCEEYRCNSNSLISVNGCGPFEFGPGCVPMTPDLSLPYPYCCPKPYCYPERPWYYNN